MSILIKLSIYIAVSVLAFGCQSKVPDAMNKLTMKPATTYLYLLRDTPFFIRLSDQQLKFVIDNSMEYEVEKGGVISVCSEEVEDEKSYWILLDGKWGLNYQDTIYPSDHGEAGKWYSPFFAPKKDCRLIMLEHGYVMKLSENSLTEMLNKGFNLHSQLDLGKSYYQSFTESVTEF